MAFDYSKLRGKIKEVFGTQAEFAHAMGLSSVSLSAKLNNTTMFTQAEINRACELLHIPLEFIPVYFFTEKVKTS
jgi:transcriptional regulator with XRE-family HTH domain